MADGIPWSDPDGTRTPTPRDTALMAAWRTFMSRPRPGNTHDWLWAAIVHGYDIAAEEIARVTHARDEAYDDAQRDAERADALAQQLAAVRAVVDGWDGAQVGGPYRRLAILAPSPVTPENRHEAEAWIESLDKDAHWARSPEARENHTNQSRILRALLESAPSVTPESEQTDWQKLPFEKKGT